MKEIVNQDLAENIILALLQGENPDTVSERYSCDLKTVYRIMGSNLFSERVKEYLEKDIIISGLSAIRHIKEIALCNEGSKATRLKANQWLAEKALEFNKLGVDSDSPATMTQDQLARRLKELQNEAIKRAKPIETGVIEHNPIDPLDDMLG